MSATSKTIRRRSRRRSIRIVAGGGVDALSKFNRRFGKQRAGIQKDEIWSIATVWYNRRIDIAASYRSVSRSVQSDH